MRNANTLSAVIEQVLDAYHLMEAEVARPGRPRGQGDEADMDLYIERFMVMEQQLGHLL